MKKLLSKFWKKFEIDINIEINKEDKEKKYIYI